MLEFVNELLKSQDNIIDQLKLLKENKNHKEVKKYMGALVKMNNSPYFKYCIDKYYFGLDVEEVKPPIPKLKPLWYLGGGKKRAKLLNQKDNIIDQLKLLRCHKGNKTIDFYMQEYLIFFANEYVAYCIKKYYYGLDVKEVEPTAKSLNIKLYEITISSILKRQEKKWQKAIKKVKEGDTIKILNGPFKGLTGIVKSVDKETKKLVVILKLFDIDTDYECDEMFEIIKEDKNDKKN